MGDFLRRVQTDHRGQTPAGWKTTLAQTYDRITTPSGITIEDLRRITAPTLILTGDRDMLCPAEEAVGVYRVLNTGELAILPGLGHQLSDAAIGVSVDFLKRHSR
jgi:pimeloyl-ACP methyl ester carboxylesterase